ncbi:9701_t:CDS:2 [Dentiscutata heterogama]|uniref:9701_t:CDS:1 n=1 Tax=Dentiscutata heterogama TaxID=1316150 RepID=A0ACA9N3P6_9GLOM|nr:9701_t:CDS:2 [Dentiscutata heterogama]
MPPVSKRVYQLQKNISIACQKLQNLKNIKSNSDISDTEVLKKNIFIDEEKAEAISNDLDCINIENNQQQSFENNQQQSIENNQQQSIDDIMINLENKTVATVCNKNKYYAQCIRR